MINTNLFYLPPSLTLFLPFIAAGMLAWIVWRLSGKLTMPRIGKPQVTRIESFVGGKRGQGKTTIAAVGSFEHRVRIAFTKIGIDAAENEEYYVMMARIVAGASMTVILMIVGLPFFTSLIGIIAGYIFVNGWVMRVVE